MRTTLPQTALLSLLCLLLSFPVGARKGGDGDSVNNGGGLSEQALVYAAGSFRSFTQSCLKFSSCGAEQPTRGRLEALLACPLPSAAQLRFGTPKDSPELVGGASGKPYAATAEKNLLLNRDFLYSPKNEPLRLPAALGFLARIYLDQCGILAFSGSASLAASLAAFADFDGEQVTVGKDNLNLPAAQWIRVRTLYSGLVVEAPDSILRLDCSAGSLERCSLLSVAVAGKSSTRFRNLSLTQEEKTGSLVSFTLEGAFNGRELSAFQLRAEYSAGKPSAVFLNGRSLELPKEDAP